MGFRIGFLANSGAMPMRSLSGISARNGARMALHFLAPDEWTKSFSSF
jgi:hypothetical protein